MSHAPFKPLSGPELPSRNDKQLRRDRATAVLIVVALLAFLAMIIWLATLDGGAPVNDYHYWMMP